MPLSTLNKLLSKYDIDIIELRQLIEAGISVEKMKLDIQKQERDPNRLETRMRISSGERFLALLSAAATHSYSVVWLMF